MFFLQGRNIELCEINNLGNVFMIILKSLFNLLFNQQT